MAPRHLRRSTMWIVAAATVALLGSCSQEGAPEVPEGADGTQDPVLVEGREVWSDNCARCHGGSGGGGSGPALSEGRAVESYPDAADMEAVIAEGRGAMPGFDGSLSAEEIEAVTAYVRDVL